MIDFKEVYRKIKIKSIGCIRNAPEKINDFFIEEEFTNSHLPAYETVLIFILERH